MCKCVSTSSSEWVIRNRRTSHTGFLFWVSCGRYPERSYQILRPAFRKFPTRTGYRKDELCTDGETQWRFINNILHKPVLGLVKISFLISLLKLRSCNQWIVASLWTLVTVNSLFIVFAMLGGIFKCWPLKKSWHPNVSGYCFPRRSYIFGTIGTTIATDFLVALVPAWIIHDLRMPLENKAAVIIFLSLSLAVTIIGCWRLQMFITVFNLPKDAAEDPHNIRNAFSNMEGNLGVIAACGPTLKWILVRAISNTFFLSRMR